MRLVPRGRRLARLVAAFALAVAIAGPASGELATTAAAAPVAATTAATTSLPCDIYAAGGTPCEAAYSTTRALFAAYDGPLYQIQRASDGSYLDIGLETTGGVVNSAPQVSFCVGTTCTITKLYDQTTNGNDMTVSPAASCTGCGGAPGPGPDGSDLPAPASALPVTVEGQPAYGILVGSSGIGYRIDDAKNVPTGDQPEGIYMMTSSNVTSGQCCFDFGSGESDNNDDGNGTMNAIYYGNDCWTGNCTGPGPWVGGDLENGMYFSDNGGNPATIQGEYGSFVSAWEKNNGTTNFTLKYGNGQQGGLTESYSGPLPPNGYDPMQVQPSILLGTGGDNSGGGTGEFFEGAVTAGYPSDATENAVQASMVAAGYTDNTTDDQPTASEVSLKAHANGDYVDAANSTTSLIADATSIGTNETFDLIRNPDGTVNLRAATDNDLVTAENAGASPLIANRTAVGQWETFDMVYNADGSISFQAQANGDYVTAGNAGASPLIADSTTNGPAQEFDLVHDTVTVSLRAHANGDIVTADDAGASPLIANRTAVGPWETFDMVYNTDGTVSFLAHANGTYVTADPAGLNPLDANRTAIGQWEEFSLLANSDGSMSLRAHANGDIVTAENAGASPLINNRTAIGPWEEFDLIYD